MKIRPWAKAILDLIETNKTTLGIDRVFYGDQDKLPAGVVVCVEPAQKQNTIKGAAWVADHDFNAYVYVYVSKIQEVQISRDECDTIAEAIEDLIHTQKTMSDTVIANWVDRIEYGYSAKEAGIVRSARLVVLGKGQTQLV